MKWFGKSWKAPICLETAHTTTPINVLCIDCLTEIKRRDQGFLIPYTGSLKDVSGSAVYEDGQVHIIYHLHCFLANLGVKK